MLPQLIPIHTHIVLLKEIAKQHGSFQTVTVDIGEVPLSDLIDQIVAPFLLVL